MSVECHNGKKRHNCNRVSQLKRMSEFRWKISSVEKKLYGIFKSKTGGGRHSLYELIHV